MFNYEFIEVWGWRCFFTKEIFIMKVVKKQCFYNVYVHFINNTFTGIYTS